VDGKVCTLASRIEPWDADVAAALQRCAPGQLIRFAQRLDPGLTGRDFADVGLRLDQMKDTRFADVGLSQPDVTALRERFADWPRDAEATGRQLRAGNAAEPQPGPGIARTVADVSRVRMTLTRPGHSSGLNRTAPPKPTGTTRRPSHNLTGPQDSLLSIITRG